MGENSGRKCGRFLSGLPLVRRAANEGGSLTAIRWRRHARSIGNLYSLTSRVSAPRVQRRRNHNVLIGSHFHETAPDNPDSTGLQWASFNVESSYRYADRPFTSVMRVGQRQDKAMFIDVISGRTVSHQFLVDSQWLAANFPHACAPTD